MQQIKGNGTYAPETLREDLRFYEHQGTTHKMHNCSYRKGL